jgi:hypothetical protein
MGKGLGSKRKIQTPRGPKDMKIEVVLERNQSRLMSISGVIGVGIGGSPQSPVIVVMVKQMTLELKEKLPRQLNGFPVRVEVSGEVTAF